jgi:GGDEF domain-containing protein
MTERMTSLVTNMGAASSRRGASQPGTLTQLHNRRYFDSRLRAIQTARKAAADIALVDLDHFRRQRHLRLPDR